MNLYFVFRNCLDPAVSKESKPQVEEELLSQINISAYLLFKLSPLSTGEGECFGETSNCKFDLPNICFLLSYFSQSLPSDEVPPNIVGVYLDSFLSVPERLFNAAQLLVALSPIRVKNSFR